MFPPRNHGIKGRVKTIHTGTAVPLNFPKSWNNKGGKTIELECGHESLLYACCDCRGITLSRVMHNCHGNVVTLYVLTFSIALRTAVRQSSLFVPSKSNFLVHCLKGSLPFPPTPLRVFQQCSVTSYCILRTSPII